MVEHLHYYPDNERNLGFRPSVVFSGVLNGDGGWSSSVHRHNFCEILYVATGAAAINIENRQHSVKSGDIIVYNTGVFHEERSLGDELSVLFFAIGNIRIPGMHAGCIVPPDASPVIESGSYDDVLKAFLLVMVDELNCKKIHYKAISTSIAAVICHYILRLYGIKVKNPEHIEMCGQFKAFIERNYQSDISLDTFTDSVHISKYHFIRMFKEATGMSPMKYLLFVRLSIARDLLGRTDNAVQEIAASVGYASAATFSRVFKNNEHISPTQYRANVREYMVT